MAIAFLIIEKFTLFVPVSLKNKKNDFKVITGIRSILALSVFIQHSVIFYFFYQNRHWDVPPSTFYTLIGQIAVAIFFSVTGFLFWNKAIENNGIVSFRNLIISRIKRIAPTYIIASLLILIISLLVAKFTLNVSRIQFTKEILILLFGMGFLPTPSLNNVEVGTIGTGVFWTLAYEWKFYLALPFLAALFLKNKKFTKYFFIICAIYISFRAVKNLHMMPKVLLFFPGIVAAQLLNSPQYINKFKLLTFSPYLCILSLLAIFVFTSTAYSFTSLFFLIIFFSSLVLLPKKHLLYKLITSRPSLLLGSISYSTYLLHMITLYVALFFLNSYKPILNMTHFFYWLIISCVLLILILASLINYRYIENYLIKR